MIIHARPYVEIDFDEMFLKVKEQELPMKTAAPVRLANGEAYRRYNITASIGHRMYPMYIR